MHKKGVRSFFINPFFGQKNSEILVFIFVFKDVSKDVDKILSIVARRVGYLQHGLN